MTDEKPEPIDREHVAEFVLKAHGDLGVVKQLLEREPAIVNAAWDWGAGDWEYVRISAIGTSTLIVVMPAVGSMPWSRPRRELRSPLTAPTASSGTVTSSSMIGSRRMGSAFA